MKNEPLRGCKIGKPNTTMFNKKLEHPTRIILNRLQFLEERQHGEPEASSFKKFLLLEGRSKIWPITRGYDPHSLTLFFLVRSNDHYWNGDGKSIFSCWRLLFGRTYKIDRFPICQQTLNFSLYGFVSSKISWMVGLRKIEKVSIFHGGNSLGA